MEKSELVASIMIGLYSIFLFELWRYPLECLEIVGLWLLLEHLISTEIPLIYSHLKKKGQQFFQKNRFPALQDGSTRNQMEIKVDASTGKHIEIAEVAWDRILQGNAAPRQERMMFATFSKGYPVSESEMRQFLTEIFGNCIESFYMQVVSPGQQALFARIVFSRLFFIHAILRGEEKAKFTVNGKHVWMRKFEPRIGRFSSMTPPCFHHVPPPAT